MGAGGDGTGAVGGRMGPRGEEGVVWREWLACEWELIQYLGCANVRLAARRLGR
jgi:hypothetical protein